MHLTQAQLAGVTGIPQSEISRIERGQTNPTVQTVDRLLAPLGARLEIVPVKQAA
jgi:transcriptional regulator with XRE-family HTH domain